MNFKNFKNKHTMITGGSNGIGRCDTETFLREGVGFWLNRSEHEKK